MTGSFSEVSRLTDSIQNLEIFKSTLLSQKVRGAFPPVFAYGFSGLLFMLHTSGQRSELTTCLLLEPGDRRKDRSNRQAERV